MKAAKRGEVFCADPMMVAFPSRIPRFSTYFREIGPLSAREPANANPKPSRMDFLPSSITSWGISWYFVPRTNWPTYSVKPGVLGKSLLDPPPAPFAESVSILEAIKLRDTLPKSPLRILHLNYSRNNLARTVPPSLNPHDP